MAINQLSDGLAGGFRRLITEFYLPNDLSALPDPDTPFLANYLASRFSGANVESEYPAVWGPIENLRTIIPFSSEEDAKLIQMWIDSGNPQQASDFATVKISTLRDYLNNCDPQFSQGIEISIGRLEMEKAIAERKLGNYDDSKFLFEEAIMCGEKYTNIPLIIEALRHLVKLDIEITHKNHSDTNILEDSAVMNATLALIIAGKLERRDLNWFVEGQLQALNNNPNIKRFWSYLVLAARSSPFRKGLLGVVSHKATRIRQRRTAKKTKN